MSKGQTLRVLVNERLTAAAEEIFALFERTIAEIEEELCRSKEENQRKQELLDSVLNPRVVLHRAGVQIPSTSPGPGLNQDLNQGLSQSLNQSLDQDLNQNLDQDLNQNLNQDLNQETPQTPQIKEEQSIKQEEEQFPVQIPEFSAVCVKTEESSLLQQRQTEHREETQGEDISTETVLHMRDMQHGDTDNEEDWRAPLSCSASQMETEANGDHHNQETSDAVNSDMSGRAKRNRTTHQCPLCQKIFYSGTTLQNHIRVHTKEKPYSCSVCKKTFTQKGNLDIHLRNHTGDKPYSCSRCSKKFVHSSKMKRHMKTHRTECE